jgi:GNAT superfamily N-acetyltransferase
MALLTKPDCFWLDDLWIEPDWMGQGIGTKMFRFAADRGRAAGHTAMEWESERHATGFYERLGGPYVRESEPGVWGRTSPVMRVEL